MSTAAKESHRGKEALAAEDPANGRLPEGYELTMEESELLSLKCYSLPLFAVSLPGASSGGLEAPGEAWRMTREALVRAARSHDQARQLARREDRELRVGDYRGATATATERVTHQNAYHAAL